MQTGFCDLILKNIELKNSHLRARIIQNEKLKLVQSKLDELELE